jgi:hypothetical protein
LLRDREADIASIAAISHTRVAQAR